MLPEELEAREKELLVLAKKWIPRLPFDRCHLLLIDQIGKNISGTGMDTNVIGRKYNDHKAVEDEFPKVKVDRRALADRRDARQRDGHRHGRVLPHARRRSRPTFARRASTA